MASVSPANGFPAVAQCTSVRRSKVINFSSTNANRYELAIGHSASPGFTSPTNGVAILAQSASMAISCAYRLVYPALRWRVARAPTDSLSIFTQSTGMRTSCAYRLELARRRSARLLSVIIPPANDLTFLRQSTGMASSRAYCLELAGRSAQLPIIIITPANDRAVSTQSTSMPHKFSRAPDRHSRLRSGCRPGKPTTMKVSRLGRALASASPRPPLPW